MTSFIFKNAPFLQCHGSTIAMLPDGTFMVAWFAGTREMHPDTAIWMCYQDPETNGKSWTRPTVVVKTGAIRSEVFGNYQMQAHWNPVLFPEPDGNMTLYFKVGRFPDSWDTWRVKIDRY